MQISNTRVRELKNVICGQPFWRFEINNLGDIYSCCPDWLPVKIGNITEVSLLRAYHSEAAQKIRESIRTGNYSYCDRNQCSHLNAYLSTGMIRPPFFRAEQQSILENKIAEKKISIMLGYDRSCNLRCPSCRNELILLSDSNIPELLRQVHEASVKSIFDLLQEGYSVHLNIAGSGDAFASPLYGNFLRSLDFHPNLLLDLQTNGVLMDETHFTEPMLRMLREMIVSVDAATADTYNRVRRGGNLELVKKNVAWLAKQVALGKTAQLELFQVNLIVQKENYKEIPDFIGWATKHRPAINSIWFHLIQHWGHMNQMEFSDKAIWQTTHPEHENFLRVLRNPILKENPAVSLGNLAPFVYR